MGRKAEQKNLYLHPLLLFPSLLQKCSHIYFPSQYTPLDIPLLLIHLHRTTHSKRNILSVF